MEAAAFEADGLRIEQDPSRIRILVQGTSRSPRDLPLSRIHGILHTALEAPEMEGVVPAVVVDYFDNSCSGIHVPGRITVQDSALRLSRACRLCAWIVRSSPADISIEISVGQRMITTFRTRTVLPAFSLRK